MESYGLVWCDCAGDRAEVECRSGRIGASRAACCARASGAYHITPLVPFCRSLWAACAFVLAGADGELCA